LEVGIGPGRVATAPIDAENVFRRHLSAFAIVIADLDRIGAALVYDDNCVQAAASRENSRGAKACQNNNQPTKPTVHSEQHVKKRADQNRPRETCAVRR
jgi:hypothetical protein